MLALNVSVEGDSPGTVAIVLSADVVEVPEEALYRANIPQLKLSSGRRVSVLAHGSAPDGCFAIVVAEGDRVLAQTAGPTNPYLNLWLRIDECDLFAHLEPKQGEQVVGLDAG
jgi:hypothetical protein